MPEYPRMYAIVCAAASEAVEAIDAGDVPLARALLLRALEAAEELYLDGE